MPQELISAPLLLGAYTRERVSQTRLHGPAVSYVATHQTLRAQRVVVARIIPYRRPQMVLIGRRWSEQGQQKYIIRIFRYGT